MLVEMTVKEFIAEVKGDSAAPGGGSVAALAGSLGAALAIMVGNLTLGNAKYPDAQAKLPGLQKKLEEVLCELERYIDEDTQVFNKVMEAYALPKETDEDKAKRSAAIQESMKKAAKLPFYVAACSLEALKFSKEMLEIGNANAASDAAVAGRMAYTGMWGAIYNVRINLGSIKDEEFNQKMRTEVSWMISHGESLMEKLSILADEKIGV